MAVFRDLTINWKGTDYTVVPSMRLMRSIEMGDISFTDIAVRTSQGRPPISHIAFVLGKMLQSAGAVVSEEEVYELLVTGSQDEVTNLITTTLMAFAPQESKGKNPDAQTGKPSKARASVETDN